MTAKPETVQVVEETGATDSKEIIDVDSAKVETTAEGTSTEETSDNAEDFGVGKVEETSTDENDAAEEVPENNDGDEPAVKRVREEPTEGGTTDEPKRQKTADLETETETDKNKAVETVEATTEAWTN